MMSNYCSNINHCHFFLILGTIPGPIVYGLFIDKSCLIWEYQCDGAATCWLYKNKQFAHSFLLITVIMKVLTLLCFTVCIVSYKPVQGEGEGEGKEGEGEGEGKIEGEGEGVKKTREL